MIKFCICFILIGCLMWVVMNFWLPLLIGVGAVVLFIVLAGALGTNRSAQRKAGDSNTSPDGP